MPETNSGEYTARSSINDVISDPVFSDYGRLLFPTERGYMSGDTLGSLGLTWYSHIDPAETVEIVNTLHERAASGETVFCDIYTDAEKAAVKAGIKEGLEGLVGKVPGLLEVHVNINGLPTSNADVMLDTTLESFEALKGYAVHPAHVAVADGKVRPYTKTRVCMDYEV